MLLVIKDATTRGIFFLEFCLRKMFFLHAYTAAIQVSLDLSLTPGSMNPNKPFVPAHVVEETVSARHAIQLMLVFLQKVNVILFRNKLQQLPKPKQNSITPHRRCKPAYYVRHDTIQGVHF